MAVLIPVFEDPLFKMLPLAINTCNDCVNHTELWHSPPSPFGSGFCLLRVPWTHLTFPIDLSDAKCLLLLDEGTDFYSK